MSEFSTKLRTAMQEAGITFEKLAERSGLSMSAINHIRSGRIKSPSRQNVEKILRAFRNPDHIHDLALAHLEDEFPAQARSLLEIKSRDGLMIKETPPAYIIDRLDHAFEEALVRARQAIPNNEDLRLAIIDVVNACTKKPT